MNVTSEKQGPEESQMAEIVPITEDEAKPRSRRRWRRIGLMLALPLAIALAGGYYWIFGGRYMATDNAYVEQHLVTMSTDVSGRIVEVNAEENQRVKAGDVLFRLDPAPYRTALEQANAGLASARLQVEQMRADYQQAVADLKSAQQTVEYYRTEFDRQQTLARNGYAARAKLDEARHSLETAEQQTDVARQRVASALAALGGDADIETDKHPLVMKALAARDQAALDLEHTTVRAPGDGTVSQTDRLNVGQYVAAATPVMTLVETGSVWIEANFKETQLTHMAVGQEATISVDAYPDREFTAEVTSIGAGTGSQFALLPPQNATGNWVKVVQRVPVRIRVASPDDAADLLAGMSAYVSVDTGYVRPLPGPARTALTWTGIAAFAASR